MTTASITNRPGNEPLASAAEQLLLLIETFIELGVLVHDHPGTQQSNTALMHKVNQLTSQLSTLSSDTNTNQYPVPVDVIAYIEDGRNPDIYTREFVEVVAKLNAKLKGKMKGFALLRDTLSDKLKEEFPQLSEEINNIRERTKG